MNQERNKIIKTIEFEHESSLISYNEKGTKGLTQSSKKSGHIVYHNVMRKRKEQTFYWYYTNKKSAAAYETD